jgi:UV DNA damage repair endonuclease
MSYNLCCISNSLAADGHKFQTMTYKRFASLPRDEAVATVSARTLNNMRVTYKILRQCYRNGWGYRISSNLFPLLTHKPANLYHGDYPYYRTQSPRSSYDLDGCKAWLLESY